jgi:hypothetical protein
MNLPLLLRYGTLLKEECCLDFSIPFQLHLCQIFHDVFPLLPYLEYEENRRIFQVLRCLVCSKP